MGDWKADKEAKIDDGEDDYGGLSRKFYLWVLSEQKKE
jgi:hypothetical protein